jgi:hypothetical protein
MMNLLAQSVTLAQAAEGHGNVAGETFIFGVIAALIFAALGLVTLSYRNVANRHSPKAEAWAARNGQDAPHEH